MSRPFLYVGMFTLLGLAAVAPAQQTSGDFAGDYSVLSDRNMFMRDRHRPRPIDRNARRPDAPDYSSPAMIEKVLVLRGVAIEDDELHAYVENTHTGDVQRLTPGDAVGNGHVAGIAIDAIEYAVDGRPVWVEIGQNLSGARVSDLPPTTGPSTGGPADPTKPAPLPPGGGTLEERMRARRAAQLQNHK